MGFKVSASFSRVNVWLLFVLKPEHSSEAGFAQVCCLPIRVTVLYVNEINEITPFVWRQA